MQQFKRKKGFDGMNELKKSISVINDSAPVPEIDN